MYNYQCYLCHEHNDSQSACCLHSIVLPPSLYRQLLNGVSDSGPFQTAGGPHTPPQVPGPSQGCAAKSYVLDPRRYFLNCLSRSRTCGDVPQLAVDLVRALRRLPVNAGLMSASVCPYGHDESCACAHSPSRDPRGRRCRSRGLKEGGLTGGWSPPAEHELQLSHSKDFSSDSYVSLSDLKSPFPPIPRVYSCATL